MTQIGSLYSLYGSSGYEPMNLRSDRSGLVEHFEYNTFGELTSAATYVGNDPANSTLPALPGRSFQFAHYRGLRPTPRHYAGRRWQKEAFDAARQRGDGESEGFASATAEAEEAGALRAPTKQYQGGSWVQTQQVKFVYAINSFNLIVDAARQGEDGPPLRRGTADKVSGQPSTF